MENIHINNCPLEIVCLIFKYLDTKALSSCMLVSKKWKHLAEYTVERLKLWDNMVKKEMINKGSSFVNKSTLDQRNIFKNFILWHHVAMSEIKHLNIYKMASVKKMKVYKDNLILITDSQVLYYDIKTYKLMKTLERSCLDFEESDQSVVELVQEPDSSQKLYVYRKSGTNEYDLDRLKKNSVNEVKAFRLENELCYVFTTRNILLRLINKVTRWEMECIGRHYGSDYDPMTTIHICNDALYMVTKLGYVWYAETHNFRFVKIHKLHVPNNISKHNWVMFDTFSCAVPVNSTEQLIKINYDLKSEVIVLECANMSCGLQHGDVLILGFSDGGVEIRMPKKNGAIEENSKLYFNIQQFLKQEDDHEILSLNVCETVNSHILFIRTRDCVHQLQLSYPETLVNHI
ncbi:unnamed protein product [Arctia plantaginis]|uniref:F-box domain-containing protein n=1 Tax=Arctia plantaginis TaxID=874455 RepID=A0A8S1AEB2_ARCPL|nr:unnamed protein product [Arctia plantaginis]